VGEHSHLPSFSLVRTFRSPVALLYDSPVLDACCWYVVNLLETGFCEQDGNVCLSNDFVVDFDDDVSGDGSCIDSFIRISNALEDCAVLKPGIYETMLIIMAMPSVDASVEEHTNVFTLEPNKPI
jgi:hypothetical protein